MYTLGFEIASIKAQTKTTYVSGSILQTPPTTQTLPTSTRSPQILTQNTPTTSTTTPPAPTVPTTQLTFPLDPEIEAVIQKLTSASLDPCIQEFISRFQTFSNETVSITTTDLSQLRTLRNRWITLRNDIQCEQIASSALNIDDPPKKAALESLYKEVLGQTNSILEALKTRKLAKHQKEAEGFTDSSIYSACFTGETVPVKAFIKQGQEIAIKKEIHLNRGNPVHLFIARAVGGLGCPT